MAMQTEERVVRCTECLAEGTVVVTYDDVEPAVLLTIAVPIGFNLRSRDPALCIACPICSIEPLTGILRY